MEAVGPMWNQAGLHARKGSEASGGGLGNSEHRQWLVRTGKGKTMLQGGSTASAAWRAHTRGGGNGSGHGNGAGGSESSEATRSSSEWQESGLVLWSDGPMVEACQWVSSVPMRAPRRRRCSHLRLTAMAEALWDMDGSRSVGAQGGIAP